jgi:beta-mannosidase
MGTLYWQINDCWPGPTWSSVDYHGQFKALHYEVKNLFEGLTAVKQKINDTERIYLLANNTTVRNVEITTSVFSIEKKGVKLLSTDNQHVSLANFNHKVLYEQGAEDSPRVIKVDLPNESHRIFLVGRLKSDRMVAYKMEVVNLDTLNHSAVLIIENEDFMADVWMFSSVPGVSFSSNFCNLLPGKHEFPFTFESNVGLIKLMYR